MKKSICFLLCCFCFLLLITGCGKMSKVVNFTASDIKNIEVYRFSIPSDAEKKIVTNEDDMKIIINNFNSLKIKGNATLVDSTAGGAMTFVFNKSDDTQLILNYDGGTIKTPDNAQNKFWLKIDNSSIFDIWDSLNYTAQEASESELPTINTK